MPVAVAVVAMVKAAAVGGRGNTVHPDGATIMRRQAASASVPVGSEPVGPVGKIMVPVALRTVILFIFAIRVVLVAPAFIVMEAGSKTQASGK